MRVFLIRHADAVAEDHNFSDDTRWLSGAGRETAVCVGGKLRELGIEVGAILTSPLVRAVQTAEIIAGMLGYRSEIRALEGLRPSGFPGQVARVVENVGEDVAIVGHEPSISALGAALCGGRVFPSFRKCEVMLVQDGALMFRLDPRTLDLVRD